MRCLYRERRYFCGDYLEVDIYPVFQKAGKRGQKAKPTSEVQERLNEHNAIEKLIRLLNANFTGEDYEFHLTYTDENLPEDVEEAKKDIQNFIRRVKTLRRRLGLEDLKYICVPEGGFEGTRFHFHITMNGGVDRTLIEELWGYGYANGKRLQFNENGVEGLARYVTKQFSAHKDELPFGKRWTASKNLHVPEPVDRDGRISAKKAKELATFECESREPFEKLWEGYTLSRVEPFYNDVNGGYYLHVKLYRAGTVFQNKKKRNKKRGVKKE
ncbi:MAG: hypothetical protein J6S14_12810 [Clostridia bacterium]|nr:hypothetical protein [Clostridia bacterium]